MTEKVAKDEYRTVIRSLGTEATIGAIFAAFPDISEWTINRRLYKMHANGELWKIGPHLRIRWFADKDTFDAFAVGADEFFKAETARIHAEAEQRRFEYRLRNRERDNAARVERARKERAAALPKPKPVKTCKPAGVVVVKKVAARLTGGEVVIPPGVKVQKLPGFKGDRFAVTGPVVGGFRTLGIGRYIE
jgi:hypothetical protein